MASANPKSVEEFQKLNNALDEIVKTLVCRICMKYPKPGQPRWYKCAMNHNICQACVETKRMVRCLCSKKIAKAADKVMEAALEMSSTNFKCDHCHTSFAKEDITAHQLECSHQLVPCPHPHLRSAVFKCDQMVKLQNIFSTHYESRHMNNQKLINFPNGSTISMPEGSPKSTCKEYLRYPVKIEAYGKVFLNFAFARDGVFYEWVQLLGSPAAAKDFVFNVEYKGPVSTCAYFGEVASICETYKSIISSGKCSAIGFESFKTQFMEGNTTKYSWVVNIKKVDE